MDRRDFIFNVGATALLAGTTGGLFAQPAATTSAPRPGAPVLRRLCRVRPNVRELTAAQLTALKRGIAVMQARRPDDPTSWAYQAAIHGSNASSQLALWGTCEHGTQQFLSWHRFYLYYFERILRAASGSASLMLPYWDWGTDRAVPAAFRDASAGNPLFVAERASGINDGALLPASAVSATAALAAGNFSGFTGSIEGSPHGAVHVSVGGWMSGFNTAGLDPVFWLHHCNIDRLWETWLAQGGGRANPTSAAWRNRSFEFFDETGNRRRVKAGTALSTCSAFSYNYTRNRMILPVLAPVLATQLSDDVAARIRKPAGAVDTAPSLTLGRRVAAASVALPPPSQGAVAKRTYLAFDDLEVTNPEGFYEIYLNPPEDKALDFTDASYAGNLVLFGLTAADRTGMRHDHATPPRRVFDITRKVAALARSRGFDPAKLRVVLVLKTVDGGSAGAVETPRARVGRVRVIVQ